MDFRRKLAYVALGCVFTLLGATVSFLSPINAKLNVGKYDMVMCCHLLINDENDDTKILIIGDKGGSLTMGAGESSHLGSLKVDEGFSIGITKGEDPVCVLRIENGHGVLTLVSKDGNTVTLGKPNID